MSSAPIRFVAAVYDLARDGKASWSRVNEIERFSVRPRKPKPRKKAPLNASLRIIQ